MRSVLAILAIPALALSSPLAAQMQIPKDAPGKPDPARVVAGTYALDSSHTLISWAVSHFEISDFFGLFSGVTGSLTIDPANASKDSVSIEVPISGLNTTNPKLTEHLNTKDYFDSAQFPAAKFVSTKVVTKGMTARIFGNLTMHGVTKPVVLDAKFVGAGTNFFSNKLNIGFSATTSFKRSDFGMTTFIPHVSDLVKLTISAAFEK